MLNLYCDESCHLENDGQKVMLVGGISCPDYAKQSVYTDIKKIKEKNGIPIRREIKWNKVSKGELDYYKELVDYFFQNELLNFRCVLVPNKSVLRHSDFHQTHDDFYFKVYFYVIKKFINTNESLQIFIDIKDTQSKKKITKLQEVLGNYTRFRFKEIENIQQIRSHENSILQLTDLLIGATSYINRDLSSSESKLEMCNYIISKSNQSLRETSKYTDEKFNLFVLNQLH